MNEFRDDYPFLASRLTGPAPNQEIRKAAPRMEIFFMNMAI
jgi:hypothetical protein